MRDLTRKVASAEDSEFVFETKKAGFKEYVDEALGWDDGFQRGLHEERFAKQKYEIIECGGERVGYLSKVRNIDVIILNQIFILPKFQGIGIGTQIMNLLIEEARSSHLSISLQVLKVNGRAKRFYEQQGFQVTSESETHVWMRKSHD